MEGTMVNYLITLMGKLFRDWLEEWSEVEKCWDDEKWEYEKYLISLVFIWLGMKKWINEKK